MKKTIWGIAIALCVGVMLLSAIQIGLPLIQYGKAGAEYAALRRTRTRSIADIPVTQGQKRLDGEGSADSAPRPRQTSDLTTSDETNLSSPLLDMNPDYMGWLQIPGTTVDYPVLRGQDNDKYLHTTFSGEENPSGAIFMDFDLAKGFNAEHCILYGHNMKDGSMFGGLRQYLKADYLVLNPQVIITTAAGKTFSYTIFSARKTDFRDSAYRVDFSNEDVFAAFASGLGAPEGTAHMLTLSTCASGGDRDERVVIHAFRKE